MASSSPDLLADLTALQSFTAEEVNAALQKAHAEGLCKHSGVAATVPISAMEMEGVLDAAWTQSGRWDRLTESLTLMRSELARLTVEQHEVEDHIRQLRAERADLEDEEDLREVVARFLEWLESWHPGLLVGFNSYTEIKERLRD